jgi:hypothetical protein
MPRGRPRKPRDTLADFLGEDLEGDDEFQPPTTFGDSTSAEYSAKDIQAVIQAPLDSKMQQKADAARVRKALMYLAKGNVHRAQAWLDRVAQDDPGRAIDLWLKMLKFTVPELRAVEVDMTMTNTDKDARKMTLGELQDLIEEKMTGERIIDGEVVDG